MFDFEFDRLAAVFGGRKIVESQKSETDQASEAMAIYNEFIAANSPTEICLSSKTRETVEEGLKKIPPVNTVFDAALEEVYGTLQRDLYLRFKLLVNIFN